MTSISVKLEELTDRQLRLHLIFLLTEQHVILYRLDKHMSDLTQSVADLQGAVDTMAIRFASQVTPLTEALNLAQEALADLTVEDEATKQKLADALSEAASAASSIESEITELNSIGAEPTVPVEPVPVEEMPEPPSTSE